MDQAIGTTLVVAGAAAATGAVYYFGTGAYLKSVLPEDVAIPTNRQQLADLLWQQAGKPEPQSSVLYADISAEASDSQKAARWCVEQGLLKDSGETFKPSTYTFRAQVIKAWNDAKDKGLVK